jgi:ABC-2 type transport system permease protein
MIYPYSIVHERFGPAAQYYLFNPIADAVLLVQRAFWVNSTPDPAYTMRVHIPDSLFPFGLLALATSVVVLGIGQWVFSSLNRKIPERPNS